MNYCTLNCMKDGKPMTSCVYCKPRKRQKQAPNKGQLLFAKHLAELKLAFREQVQFKPDRRWKFDFVLSDSMIAIEIDGFYKGRHGAGWGGDYEKQNVAIMLGWRVLRFTTQEVERGKAKAWLAEWIGGGK